MNKTQKYLLGALGLQIILIVVVFLLQRPVAASNNLIFPDLNTETVSEIVISDSSGNLLDLKKEGDQWVLPEQDNYPVNTDTVQQLVNNLATIRDNRLVTQSESSQERLKISDSNFERKVQLTINGKEDIIYFGSSPAANNIHFRLDGKNEVYLTNAVTSSQITTTFTSWVDTVIYQIGSTNVQSVAVTNAEGDFLFTLDSEGNWTSNQVQEGYQFDQSMFSSLLTGFTNMRLVAPVSKTDSPEFGLSDPQTTVEIHYTDDSGTELTGTLIIGNTDEENNYYAKWSGNEYIFKISSYNAERITNLTSEKYSSQIPTEESNTN